MKVYLKFNILPIVIIALMFIASCSPKLPKYDIASNNLNRSTISNIEIKPPKFNTLKYTCVINGKYAFKKYHLSGILVLKSMEDNATRAVFQNEMGMTYFDFEWDQHDSFKINHIIEKMDNKALVKSLQKDFEILLFKNEINKTEKSYFTINADTIIQYPIKKGFVAYHTTSNKIVNIKVINNNKVYITFDPKEKYDIASLPQELLIQHHKANYTIQLKSFTDEYIIEE